MYWESALIFSEMQGCCSNTKGVHYEYLVYQLSFLCTFFIYIYILNIYFYMLHVYIFWSILDLCYTAQCRVDTNVERERG